MYCVKCRKHTETLNTTTFTAKNGRPMRKGICADCGKAKTQFIKTGSGLFNKAMSKLPFQMHLPGHNFTRPGTRLDRRTVHPKSGASRSMRSTLPLNITTSVTQTTQTERVETKSATEMLKELNSITNPTLRERVDKGIVRNIINAKVNLGLGLKKSFSDVIKWTDRLPE